MKSTLVNWIDLSLRKGYVYAHLLRRRPDFEEVSLGDEYPDKRFLVIRRFAPMNAGLLSFFFTTIGWIRYALQNDMIPVVDMQTYLNQMLDLWEVGRKNAWEYYFEQPCGFSLPDIKRAKNVTIVNKIVSPVMVGMIDMLESPNVCAEVRALVRQYVRIKAGALAAFYNPELERALSNPDCRVVGVRARGTDYSVVKPQGHCIQPTAEHFIDYIRTLPPEYMIYLVSEDVNILKPMLQTFGERIILSKQSLPEYKGGWMPNCRTLNCSRREEGAGYLKAIYDLSRCDVLIGGGNNGTAAAYAFSDGFEKFHLFELGKYD